MPHYGHSTLRRALQVLSVRRSGVNAVAGNLSGTPFVVPFPIFSATGISFPAVRQMSEGDNFALVRSIRVECGNGFANENLILDFE